MIEIARWIVALLCLVVSLTAFFKAPNLPVWMLSLGATEYGHWFALLALLVAGTGGMEGGSLLASGIALVAAGLFLTTLGRALPMASRLPAELRRAFGPASAEGLPFSWKRLIFGRSEVRVLPEPFVYHAGDGFSLKMNFFRSQKDGRSPCVIVLHTGGWNSGTVDEFNAFNSHLAHEGYAVAALEYRLAPQWTWPAQREDVEAGMAFLKAQSENLAIDPKCLVLLGRSAGGHIAETVAFSGPDPGLRGCIAFYAPADMHYAYRFGREDDMLKSLQVVRDFMGGTPQERPEQYDSASPIRFVTRKTVPTLLFHGRPDPLVWALQSQRLNDRLEEEGVPHLLIEPPWATHAFDYNFNGPGGQLSTYAVDYFLSVVTRRSLPISANREK